MMLINVIGLHAIKILIISSSSFSGIKSLI